MKKTKFCSAQDAVKAINSENSVFIHTTPMSPNILVDAMVERASELRNVKIFQIITNDDGGYARPELKDSFNIHSLFVGGNVRRAVNSPQGSYTPTFLSQMPRLFEERYIDLDVALIQVSPPDAHGYCSIGVSLDTSLAAMKSAKTVIAQVNSNVPRAFGDGYIHLSEIDYAVEHNSPIAEVVTPPPSEVDAAIGEYIAELIEDGSNLQVGIGALPNAVLGNLKNHKNLGIHTEIFSDGVLPLIKSGVINGKNKRIDTEKIVSTFLFGAKNLYDFVHDNPKVMLKPSSYTNNPCVISQNDKAVAINSALEIDLTGQICADTLGAYQFSGVGGQLDFTLGSSMSKGGKPIFGISSKTHKGISKIVPSLKQNAGVTTTRAHVQWVVTEYGAVNLFGKSNKERAKLLISIAHPDFREELDRQAFELFRFE
ncbi:acetyl-CoA hydrolase/transferase family protein [Ornithobacterium rhinotracheale]|uniref:acetyl-CoA hydrolase/transferase family protein n=1 Tax=Ornithobacterium rhinotracheale TaxID=28251 RepID=UPI004036621B